MKKSILLLIPSLFLMTSCTFTKVESPINKEEEEEEEELIVDPNLEKHPSKINGGDHKYPFYLKVGTTATLQPKLTDPAPTLDIDKNFNWQVSNSPAATFKIAENTLSATVTGEKPGIASAIATNTYNTNLSVTFNVNVIEFDNDNDYLWEFETDSSARAKFGYVNEDGKKAGVESGTANLAGLDWDFTRSNVSSLQSGEGGLGFGKGKEPETNVKLVNHNDRKVKSIAIETGSANGLANVKVKVGDEEVINEKTSSSSGGLQIINSKELDSALEGDISIEFNTPEFDQKAYDEDPIAYKAPGAVYLKSILIRYEAMQEPDYVTESTIDFKNIFDHQEENTDFSVGIGTSPSAKDYTQDGIKYHFDKIKKDNKEGRNTHYNVNSFINITVPEGELIYKVEFKTVKLSSSKNIYNPFGSILGGEPYNFALGSGTDGETNVRVKVPNINSIQLKNSGNVNVGLVSLSIKTIAGTHAEIDKIEFPENAMPTKVNYNVGEPFNPEGMADATITFTDSSIEPLKIPASSFEWCDGASYEANPSVKTNIMSEGSTCVYGIFRNYVLKIEGITVSE